MESSLLLIIMLTCCKCSTVITCVQYSMKSCWLHGPASQSCQKRQWFCAQFMIENMPNLISEQDRKFQNLPVLHTICQYCTCGKVNSSPACVLLTASSLVLYPNVIQNFYLVGQLKILSENGIIMDNNVTENASVNLVSQTISVLIFLGLIQLLG